MAPNLAPHQAPHQAQGACSWSGLRLTRGSLPQGRGQASILDTPESRVPAGQDWAKRRRKRGPYAEAGRDSLRGRLSGPPVLQPRPPSGRPSRQRPNRKDPRKTLSPVQPGMAQQRLRGSHLTPTANSRQSLSLAGGKGAHRLVALRPRPENQLVCALGLKPRPILRTPRAAWPRDPAQSGLGWAGLGSLCCLLVWAPYGLYLSPELSVGPCCLFPTISQVPRDSWKCPRDPGYLKVGQRLEGSQVLMKEGPRLHRPPN